MKNNELVVYKPASFIYDGKYRRGVELVTSLIKKSIEENKAIEKEDILDLYWLFKSHGGTKAVFIHNYDRAKGAWEWIKATRENFGDNYRIRENAPNWFKNNLGSAIIQGKLLVIPIINIE